VSSNYVVWLAIMQLKMGSQVHQELWQLVTHV